ncbi:MAG: magnesium/cobalt transporter CorA [bacterium]
MYQILLCSPQGDYQETQDVERLREAMRTGSHYIWVDMEEPSEEEVDVLLEVFNFHPLAIEHVLLGVGSARLDVYEKYAFLALHRLFYNFETETCERREFEVFFSERFIVTVHRRNLSRTFAAARQRVHDAPKETLGDSPSYVLLNLLELAIKDYEPIMEEWQDNLEDIEQQVLRGAKDEVLDPILKFKKLVASMRKSLLPERDVYRQLDDKHVLPFIKAEARPYFKTVMEDMNTLLQDLESLREHAGSVFDVYAAVLTIRMTESSNQLNFIMQRLTIAATIFLPLTFIVGVYGMNFNDMPEFQWPGFYYILWGLMIALVVGMLTFFKKKKWI